MINYTKTDWNSGDVITKAKMDNIENGLEAAINEINTLNNIDVENNEFLISFIEGNNYINGENGNVVAIESGFQVTDFISITGGGKLIFTYPYYSNSNIRLTPIGYAFYNNNQQFIEGQIYVSSSTPGSQKVLITTPSAAAYVRFTVDLAYQTTTTFKAWTVKQVSIKEYIDSKFTE